MVVAIKKDDRVVVGISVGDSLIDMTENDLALYENVPFWKVKGNKNCYVFAEDMKFSTDLLRYNDYIFKDVSDGKSVIETVMPRMKELLKKYGQTTEDTKWDSRLLIVKDNKTFIVDRYFSVDEADEYVGLGYESILVGGLEESKGLPPKESILFALKTFNRARNRNIFPLVLFDTKTKKKEVIFNMEGANA